MHNMIIVLFLVDYMHYLEESIHTKIDKAIF